MIRQQRRNENRFYRYPKRRVVAVIDDSAQLDAAVRDLDRARVDMAGVQGGAYESDALRAHEQALNDGHHVIYVPVRGQDDRAKVADILRATGGHYLLYFGAWSIAQLPA